MNRLRLSLLILIVAAAIAQAQDVAPDTQVGNFLFKMPAGWKPVKKGDTTIVYAPALPPNTVTYFALAAGNIDGDLQNSFAELWGGFRNAYRVLQGGQTAPFHSKRGYDAFYTTAVAADKDGVRWNVYVLAAQYKNRVQTVMFMSNLPAGPRLSAYERVFQQTFLASLSFGETLPGSATPPKAAEPAVEQNRQSRTAGGECF